MATLKYMSNLVEVQINDVVQVPRFGTATIIATHLPREPRAAGRVTLALPDGRVGDFLPFDIGAKWV